MVSTDTGAIRSFYSLTSVNGPNVLVDRRAAHVLRAIDVIALARI